MSFNRLSSLILVVFFLFQGLNFSHVERSRADFGKSAVSAAGCAICDGLALLGSGVVSSAPLIEKYEHVTRHRSVVLEWTLHGIPYALPENRGPPASA